MRHVKVIYRESLSLALWAGLLLAAWQTALAASSMPEETTSLTRWIHFSLYSLGGFFLLTFAGLVLASIVVLVVGLFKRNWTAGSIRRFLLAAMLGFGILVAIPCTMPGPIRPLLAAGSSGMQLAIGITVFVLVSFLVASVLSLGFMTILERFPAKSQWSLLWGAWLFFIVTAPIVIKIAGLPGSIHPAVAGMLNLFVVIILLFAVILFTPRFYNWMQKGGTGRWVTGASLLVLIFILTIPFPRPLKRGLPADENSPPVILFTIDTLRADALDCYSTEGLRLGTPNMNRIAEEGTLFENAFSAAPWTLPGVASFLTGLSPGAHGAVDYHNFNVALGSTSLAEIFSENGYVTAGFTVNPLLGPGHGMDQGFDYYVEEDTACNSGRKLLFERLISRIRLTWPDLQTPNFSPSMERRAIRQARRFVRDHQGERYFLWVHLCAPHQIWFPPGLYRERIRSELGIDFSRADILRQKQLTKGQADITAEYLDRIHALYAGEVTFSDDLTGELVSELESLGVYDDCIFVLTSDHGEEFYEHDRITHAHSLYKELLHVPLIIRSPGKIPAGLQVTENVSTVDIAPTLLDLAGIRPQLAGDPAEFTGRSLVGALTGGTFEEMPVFFEAPLLFDRNVQGVLMGDYFYIGGVDAVLHPRLYDLFEDSETYYDILRDHPEIAEALAQLVYEHSALCDSIAERIGSGPGGTNLESFRALGYLN